MECSYLLVHRVPADNEPPRVAVLSAGERNAAVVLIAGLPIKRSILSARLSTAMLEGPGLSQK